MGFPQKSKILEKIIKEIISWEKRNERDKNRKIVHHDFQAKNIILGKGKISVIDFSESRLSKPIIDVFTFLIQLELMNNYFKNPFSLKTIKNFSNIFLKEYFKNQEKDIFKNRIFQKDFNLLKKRIACQSLVGAIISNKKPKILSDILFGKERNYFF